jgi:hypothetical protein
MYRRQFLANSLIAGVSTSVLRPSGAIAGLADSPTSPLDYRIDLQTPAKHFDGKESYCHPRAGIVPGAGKDGLPRVAIDRHAWAKSSIIHRKMRRLDGRRAMIARSREGKSHGRELILNPLEAFFHDQ